VRLDCNCHGPASLGLEKALSLCYTDSDVTDLVWMMYQVAYADYAADVFLNVNMILVVEYLMSLIFSYSQLTMMLDCFSIEFECERSIRMLQVGIQYSVHDPICVIIGYGV